MCNGNLKYYNTNFILFYLNSYIKKVKIPLNLEMKTIGYIEFDI